MIQDNGPGAQRRVSSGVPGLDEVLGGGFLPRRAYLVRGGPGAGKTTLGLHFLATGAAEGEPVLFLNQGETSDTVHQDAESLGISLDGVSFLDLSPDPKFFSDMESYDVFTPGDVEREPFARQVVEHVQSLQPTRIFVDAMTQLRHVSNDLVDFRRQAHSFLRFLLDQGATVIFASGTMSADADEDLQFMSHGVLHLDYNAASGRTVRVTKLRGSAHREGRHSAKVSDRGLEVFPRLQPQEYGATFEDEMISSGIPGLDEILHGGIERGSVTLISGPTGVGKTTVGMHFMKEAAGRGERSVVYTFEESVPTLVRRSAGVNIPVAQMIERGTLTVAHVEPLQHTPDQFALRVRREVEDCQARIVMVDSLSGYRLSMQGEDLVAHLHALCAYLRNMGVTVIVINEIQTITGEFRATDIGISYLADNIVFLRYLEMRGELLRAVGVLKKRLSNFEKSLRLIDITRYGLNIGEPLTGLRGILAGLPEEVDQPGRR